MSDNVNNKAPLMLRRESKVTRIAVIILQLMLGVVFIFSGVSKGIDPIGSGIKIGEYAVSFGVPISPQFALICAIALNIFETTLGFALLIGLAPRVTSILALVLMVPMTLLTLYIAIFNPVADCGCFGDALKISNSATFWKNVVLLAITIYLYLKQDQWWHLLPKQYDLFVALATAGVVLLFNLYPLQHLPVIDFRPYKVGSNLYDLTIGGAEEGEYDYRFVYERNGEEQSFGLDELADVDSSWTYVRDETIELKAPVQAPGADFILTREDGHSPMLELIEPNSGYTLLYFLPDLYRMGEEELQLGVELQKLTGEPVWLVMSTNWSVLDDPLYSGYAKQYSSVLFLDRSTALTVIRTQPGLVVLKDGEIIRKMSDKDLNDYLLKEGAEAKPHLLTPMRESELKGAQRMAFAPLVLWTAVLLLLAWALKRQKKRAETQ